ncbi:hypothetical protein BGZ63DRAFT_491712 [Mariannaea sp. PMI_226]|nr:hypothetical protein BGZ63DRAFT_491712 [Mariannaea sp. PMI_226]
MYYHFQCGSCSKTFPSGFQARENHCSSTGHERPQYECESCPRWFRNQSACNQHMDALNHWPYECAVCDETWPTAEQRKDHQIRTHFYCGPCKRQFQSFNNIKMHLQSRIHQGTNIRCPFCRETRFATATGLTHHLETGSCSVAHTLNRDTIYQFIRSKDPQGIVSKNLIEWQPSYSCEVNGKSWNGWAYECYICGRTYKELQSLNQHVNSPVHQQALYHCPQRGCAKDFKTLASLVNHLQSESCGCIPFHEVQRGISDFIRGNRMLEF